MTTVHLNPYALMVALEEATASNGSPGRKLAIAASQIVAHLPEPSEVSLSGVFVDVNVGDEEEFVSSLYTTLHCIKVKPRPFSFSFHYSTNK